MPTIVTHAIVPLAIAAAAGRGRISPKVALAGAALVKPRGAVRAAR